MAGTHRESRQAELDVVPDLTAGRHPDLIGIRGKGRRRRVDLDVSVHGRHRARAGEVEVGRPRSAFFSTRSF